MVTSDRLCPMQALLGARSLAANRIASWMARIGPRRAWRACARVAGLVSTAAIVSTYHVFSNTYDEPAHLASGMEWLSKGQYQYEPIHPPLARVFVALGPYLAGKHSTGAASIWTEGRRLLGFGDDYRHTLTLARMGVLPFFVLLLIAVWLWGIRLGGESAGALAVAFVASNPTVLAHAGLATTDIAPTALMAFALLAYARWTERPSWPAAFGCGAALALVSVSKFSVGSFLVVVLVLAEILRVASTRRWRIHRAQGGPAVLASIGGAALLALVLVWGAYRFSYGPIVAGGRSVPSPELFRGLSQLIQYSTMPHPAFLLGVASHSSWWYYFPVALLVKTPLPLLIASALGTVVLVREARRGAPWQRLLPLVAIAGVMAVAMAGRLNIGIRHVLPVYPMMALAAAIGVQELWRMRATRLPRSLAVALVAFALLVPVRAHPDHLPYFNVLAGRHPERVLTDSNLDWGQDLYRLAYVVKRLKIDSVRVAYFGSANLEAAGVPHVRVIYPYERPTGWVAASETLLAGANAGDDYAWFHSYEPVGRVGPSLRLYFIPEPTIRPVGSLTTVPGAP
jgi:hypothetical protein